MKRLLMVLLMASASARASVVIGTRAAAATPAPVATRVATAVLRDGGSAVDAAIAASLVLAVIQPQNGGLGGGGCLLYFEKQSGAVWALDFRESAPRLLPRSSAGVGAQSGIPGTMAGLGAAHDRFGKLPWKILFQPAISIAHGGTIIEGPLHSDLLAAEGSMAADAKSASPWRSKEASSEGANIVQDSLARTLGRLAEHGWSDFYSGTIARQLLADLRQNGSTITMRDLGEYKAIWRAPIRIDFADQAIYAPPPPSRVGFVLAEALGALRSIDLPAAALNDATTIHLMSEALRRAQVDARQHVGDPTSSRNAYAELLTTARLEAVARAIDPLHAAPPYSAAATVERQAIRSTDVITRDEEGNIACLVTSLGPSFGSAHFSTSGFYLNSAMLDFDPGEVNDIQPLRRPASVLAPLLILRDGAPLAALSAAGGEAGSGVLLQLIIDSTIYGSALTDAVDSPRYWHGVYPDRLFYEQLLPEALQRLATLGHATAQRSPIGAVQAIVMIDKKLVAVSDPRSGGAAGGY